MSKLRHWLIMVVLSLSGGIIFFLPFLQEVYYKPLADALGLNNTEVGSLLSVFGVTSLLSYFPGGWLADRVSPRKLISLSLLLTGVTGLYFSTFPGYQISLVLHAFWGVTISLLFWGSMIRVTRNWAPADEQGKAFGILETGRGLGEVFSSAAILAVFVALGSGDTALSTVVVLFSVLILILGVLAWITLEDEVDEGQGSESKTKIGLQEIIKTLKMPVVWLIAIVVLTGYCAYWGTFRITSYASDIFMMSVTIAATISVGKMWLKPFGALAAGFIADKLGIARSVAYLFLILIISFCVFAIMPGNATMFPLMLLNVAIASIVVFAMRGIYFALLEEGGIPMAVTGTAAGIVSAVGYTPDIFMPLLGGVLLDNYPGVTGYRYFFFATAAICTLGLVASLTIYYRFVKPQDSDR
jgi:sugar phosphate permease